MWPTSRAEDSESCGNHPGATDSLTGMVRQWPTATATDSESSAAENYPTETRHPGTTLTDASRNWKTPHGMAGIDHTGKIGGDGEFAKQAEQWQTPKAGEEDSGSGMNSRGEPKLKAQALSWPTPNSSDEKGISQPADDDLPSRVDRRPTPAERDHRSPNAEPFSERGGQTKGEQLPNFVEHKFSHRVRSILDGSELSPTTRTLPRRLNPAFVCWLMGTPIWLTNPGVTNSVQSEMVEYRSALRSRLRCLLGE